MNETTDEVVECRCQTDYEPSLQCQVEGDLWKIERVMKQIAYFAQEGRARESDIEWLDVLTARFMEVRSKIIDAIKG